MVETFVVFTDRMAATIQTTVISMAARVPCTYQLIVGVVSLQ